jgi:ElaB/YqjD/DUF883 family membrane-anchored ribosome-binding protein
MGYIQEVLLDDFKAARDTYAKVLQSYASTPAAQQADQRLKSLQKIEELRAATSADTTGRKQAAAAAFMVAEHYLYDSGRPERAILEFGHVESLYTDTEYAPRAAFAVAWAFTHQLDRQASADSVWRDLLLRWPDAPLARAASACLRGKTDSLRVAGALEPTLLSAPLTPGAAAYTPPQIDLRSLRTKESAPAAPGAGKTGIGAVRDSSGIAGAARDSTKRVAAAGDSVKFTTAPRDTSRAAPRDTSRVAPRDTSAVAPRDTSAVAPRDTTKVARPDTTRTPAH